MSEDKSNVPVQDENVPVEPTTDVETQEKTDLEPSEEVVEPKKEEKERPVYTMPVSKAQKEKEKAAQKAREEVEQKYQQEIEQMKADYERKLSDAKPFDHEEELNKLVESHGLDKQATKDLLNMIKKIVPTPDLSKYDSVLQEAEIAKARIKVSDQFDADIVPLIKKDFPDASESHIQQVKGKISELAFAEGYNSLPLDYIYFKHKDDFAYKNKFTAEPSGRSTDTADLSSLSEEEAMNLPPQEYRKWSDLQAGKQSKYLS